MLIHYSQRIFQQARLTQLVQMRFSELRDEWRYQRESGLRERFRARWETEFRPVTSVLHGDRDVPFDSVEQHLGPFFEAVQVREINSATGQVLDYDREPRLKAIAIGGNRLSRGLTLEGLLVSFFVRRSVSYDTLMQMGRWFGFRAGYEDLTRIHTTGELSSWFADLAYVEHRLREDIKVYEEQGLTPLQVGMRIWQHPAMQVTSRLKSRFATTTRISQSYRLSLEQTFKFPLRRLDVLSKQEDANLAAVCALFESLGPPTEAHTSRSGPVWTGVSVDTVRDFLGRFRIDDQARSISIPLILSYIERLSGNGELTTWTIGVRGREQADRILGTADWHLPTGPIAQISRSRLGDGESVGVITTPGDEAVGMSPAILEKAKAREAAGASVNRAARQVRPPEEGLLLLYPISKQSGHDAESEGTRRPLFDNPDDPMARNLIGLAISFPDSKQTQVGVDAEFVEGSVGWRAVE
jgi:hypothetical protein